MGDYSADGKLLGAPPKERTCGLFRQFIAGETGRIIETKAQAR